MQIMAGDPLVWRKAVKFPKTEIVETSAYATRTCLINSEQNNSVYRVSIGSSFGTENTKNYFVLSIFPCISCCESTV